MHIFGAQRGFLYNSLRGRSSDTMPVAAIRVPRLCLLFLLVGFAEGMLLPSRIPALRPCRFPLTPWMSAANCVQVGEQVQVEVDVAPDDSSEELVWASATVSEVDPASNYRGFVRIWTLHLIRSCSDFLCLYIFWEFSESVYFLSFRLR